jgi:UDP-N-acetyl-2-amino-2-deoxyglucuronate dehydrogenase
MIKNPKFVLMGAAGFVAPRHMDAIKRVGGKLVAACDPHDAVGVLDRYFPRCNFYTEFVEMLATERADYAVICTPNHTHTYLACLAVGAGMDVIMEKPAAVSVEALTGLKALADKAGKTVNCILQMRLHHDAHLMMGHAEQFSDRQQVDIEYHTPRGPWYQKSWKSDTEKSGGLVFNIGVHLFDMALQAYGTCRGYRAKIDGNLATGFLNLDRADVDFNLSINGQEKQRVFKVGKCEYDFTNGFDDLHVESYRRILDGKGFTLEDALPAIDLCEKLTASSGKELESIVPC